MNIFITKKSFQIVLIMSMVALFFVPQHVFAFGCQVNQPGQPAKCQLLGSGVTDATTAGRACTQICAGSPAADDICTVVTDDAACRAMTPNRVTPAQINPTSPKKGTGNIQVKVTHLDNPLQSRDFSTIIGRAAGKVFGLIGTLSVLVFIYGGFIWLTAAGSEEKIKMGSRAMGYAAIGIIVIFSSFAILNTVIQGLVSGNIPEPPKPSSGGVPANCTDFDPTLGFACRPIDTCQGVIWPGSGTAADTARKRQECDASGGTCYTGKCNATGQGSGIVCCQRKTAGS